MEKIEQLNLNTQEVHSRAWRGTEVAAAVGLVATADLLESGVAVGVAAPAGVIVLSGLKYILNRHGPFSWK